METPITGEKTTAVVKWQPENITMWKLLQHIDFFLSPAPQYTHTLSKQISNYTSQHSLIKEYREKEKSDTSLKCFWLVQKQMENLASYL